MGVRNFLIEGVSGAGKTAVATELQARGYQAIHGDRELAYRGDRQTGQPAAPGMSGDWIWDVEKVKAHIANRDQPLTFFCGGSRNFPQFIGLLDGVFILEVDEATMNRRIDERVARDPTDFGAKPHERDEIARLYATQEDVPKAGIRIDATAPLAAVVDEILARCGVSPSERRGEFR